MQRWVMIKRLLRIAPCLRAALFLFLLAAFMAQPACGTAISYLPTAIAYAQDAAFILDQVQRFVDRYFADHPQPDLQKKVDTAAARTRAALSLALRAAAGVDNLTKDQTDAAFADFRGAWAELLILVKPMGVSAGAGDRMAAVPGGLVVPEPLAAVRR